jgi:hypothetical protein
LLAALAFSFVCIGLAGSQWKRPFALAVPSLVAQPARSRWITGARKAALLTMVLSAPQLCAADLSSYRGFSFGVGVEAIARHAGLKPTDAKVIHTRPALIQELEWQVPLPRAAENSRRPDPVRDVSMHFLDGKLYRLVITYDRYRIEGMTGDDMIEAISLTYGAAVKPETQIAFHSNYAEVAKVLARWQDGQYAYDLIRTGDRSSFALVLYSKQQDALAQAAILEASRLDALDAPSRALEAEKKRMEEERVALEARRVANIPNFRP